MMNRSLAVEHLCGGMTTFTTGAKTVDAFLSAIVQDDRKLVGRLLKKEPGLATRLVETPKLYDSVIYHWIYVGDSALHLAAAGC